MLSIDIDFNDYWIWKAIRGYSPRVVVIEYNSSIPPAESKTIEYDQNAHWDGTNYFGASLLALTKLSKSKGYTLVACDKKGTNAFFVKTDLIKNNFKVKEVKKIYNPPKYGKKVNGKYIGHPPSNKSMSSILISISYAASLYHAVSTTLFSTFLQAPSKNYFTLFRKICLIICVKKNLLLSLMKSNNLVE
ncbi:MAG: hypothetical protein P9L98_05235 [Candidatus Kaelpia imicola]|nr:hypothetical protein [Candidatus Kaelpia imicola]